MWEMAMTKSIEVGGLYRSSGGNLWRVVQINDDRVQVKLEGNVPGSGTTFWWDMSSTGDLEPVGIEERIRNAIRTWPQWSPAERRRLGEIEEEILDHCRDGNGNAFTRDWCRRFLTPEVTGPLFTG